MRSILVVYRLNCIKNLTIIPLHSRQTVIKKYGRYNLYLQSC